MNLFFYNTFSIGDFFFSQPVIKHICINNADREFKIHTPMGSYLFKTIANLSQIDHDDNPHGHPIRHTIDRFFMEYKDQLVFHNEDKIFINTWVGAMRKLEEGFDCECDSQKIHIAFCKIIEHINNTYKINISFPPLEKKNMIYTMPTINIDSFLEFKAKTGRETIFYFNRMGQSASTKPFQNENDHIRILDALSLMFPEKTIIVPNLKLTLNRNNIVHTSRFRVIEDHTCKNVLEEIEIAGNCTYLIAFDVGSILTYCNSNFESYTAKIFHFSKNERYLNLMRKNLEECLGVNTMKIQYVHSETPEEVLVQIRKRIQ